jgi:hypothetical protein
MVSPGASGCEDSHTTIIMTSTPDPCAGEELPGDRLVPLTLILFLSTCLILKNRTPRRSELPPESVPG